MTQHKTGIRRVLKRPLGVLFVTSSMLLAPGCSSEIPGVRTRVGLRREVISEEVRYDRQKLDASTVGTSGLHRYGIFFSTWNRLHDTITPATTDRSNQEKGRHLQRHIGGSKPNEKFSHDSSVSTDTERRARLISNNPSSGLVATVATVVFVLLGAWFCYHYFIEKVQEMVYEEAVKSAKQDLLSSAAKITEENVVVFNRNGEPTDGQYCALYLEPQRTSCGSAELEHKYEINLYFDREICEEESISSLNGWSIHGDGIDSRGNPITIESGFVTKQGHAVWTEQRVGPTVLCNGRFNFFKRTFNGAWLARNGYGGEFIRFYHKKLSVYKNVDMDAYAYKGPLDGSDDDETTKRTEESVIDLSGESTTAEREDPSIIQVDDYYSEKEQRHNSQQGQKISEQIVGDCGKSNLSIIEEETTITSAPISHVSTACESNDSSTCSGLSASYSSCRRSDDYHGRSHRQ